MLPEEPVAPDAAPRPAGGRAREDVQLLRRIAAGDQHALDRLFVRHGSVVLGVLVRLLGERARAEAVLEDTFVEAWRRSHEYDDGLLTPLSWLLRISRTLAIAARPDIRSGRHEVTPSRREAPGASQGSPQSHRVVETLAALPAEQRECIELAFFGGLTHSQIAERLQVPGQQVRHTLLSGMNALRSALAQPDAS
ncbi:MAG: sigma-70 family RNA polymerase sigma factor [Acidobacteriota bacterium]